MPIPMTRSELSIVLTAAAFVVATSATTRADTHQIDTAQSKLTVYVYKSGLFSGFADDHVIDGSIATGMLSDASPLSVAIEVRAAELKVRNSNLSASKRDEVQTRMVGPQVLDTQKFPSIAFASTMVSPNGTDRWNVTGRLTIHGQTQTLSFPVTLTGGHYRGTVTVKQRDYGIIPISIAGGTVKVKDELKIEFDIVVR